MLTLIAANAAVTGLRFVPGVRRLMDPPLRVLIRDGKLDRRNLRRCGLTQGDLDAILRQNGYLNAADVKLALFARTGSVSVVTRGQRRRPTGPAILRPSGEVTAGYGGLDQPPSRRSGRR